MRILSRADVACTSTTVASAILALEISNDFLLSLKREGKYFLEETNKVIGGQAIVLDVNCLRLQSSFEKAAGKLATKFKAKGSWERNKIKCGKTRITVSSRETVNFAAVEERLQQAEVKDDNKRIR